MASTPSKRALPVYAITAPSQTLLNSYISKIVLSSKFSNHGPLVRTLESRFASLLGVSEDNCVCVSSATLGIFAALVQIEVDDWRIPAFSFPAAPSAAVWAKKRITFGDVGLEDWKLVEQVNPEEKSDFVVLPFGAPLRDQSLSAKTLVIDAAASLANSIGTFEQPDNAIVVFSLHATKPLGGGEGGLVVAPNSEIAKAIRSFLNFGFSGSRESSLAGVNGKMSEFDAAVIHARLDEIDIETAEWDAARKLVEKAEEELGELIVDTPLTKKAGRSPYWIVRFSTPENRKLVVSYLENYGISSRLWWSQGCDKMRAFRHLPSEKLTNTRAIAGSYLGLPFFRGISSVEIETIVDVIKSVPLVAETI